MKGFGIRLLNVALIVGCIVGYNQVLQNREKEDTVARLTAELETEQLKNEALAEQEAVDAESGSYQDGVYKGSAEGFGGEIQVTVTVSQGKIADVSVVSAEKEDKAYLESAENVIPKIVDAQSADVDAVSGATFSSNGIKNAVKQALEQAVR